VIVRWSRAAARQLFEAGDYLKQARPGLDEQLYAASRQLTELIAHQPRAFTPMGEVRNGDVRKALVRRFGYWVIYEVFEAREECVVLAFWHTRRHPEGWRQGR
jgi:plasmid stabilization system protein ParE